MYVSCVFVYNNDMLRVLFKDADRRIIDNKITFGGSLVFFNCTYLRHTNSKIDKNLHFLQNLNYLDEVQMPFFNC